MSDIRCIGIATGGGDAPGLNAVIRAATKAAILKYGWKVMGIRDGFDGLIWPEKAVELTLQTVSGIMPRGGTILGTTNRGNPFQYKTVENGVEVVRDISDQVIANASKLGIDATKKLLGEGFKRPWPPLIKMDPAVKAKMDSLLNQAGSPRPTDA
jgi:6-phosphofructokinase